MRVIYSILFFLLTQIIVGQINSKEVIKIKKELFKDTLNLSDHEPYYIGGLNGMNEFVSKNIQIPKSVSSGLISGTVFINFTINDSGAIRGIKILKGIKGCQECSDEAARVVKLMPKFIPARINNKYVSSPYSFPIRFGQK